MFRKSLFAIGLAYVAFTSGPAFGAINAADYGVSTSNGDNAAALQKAFDAGRAAGEEVIVPSGQLKYGKLLKINGTKVRGSGGTVLVPTNTLDQAIILSGSGPALENVRIAYKPEARGKKSANGGNGGVKVLDATGFSLKGLHLDGQSVAGPGPGGGGIFVRQSKNGIIEGSTVNNSMADSIHITTRSENIQVLNNRIHKSGDDGIAVVNNSARNVHIEGNTVTENRWGRGITAVGGQDVKILNNTISGNGADLAGILIASEANYNTGAPKGVVVRGNTIQNTGGRSKGHGQIMLSNGGGAPDDVTITGNVVRGSEDGMSVVVSGGMGGINISGNAIDGEISKRNGGGFSGENKTGTGQGAGTVSDPPKADPVGGGGDPGPSTPPPPPLNAEKIETDIANLRARALSEAAIKYLYALDGIRIPPDVLSGNRSVADAIRDGTLKRDNVPTNLPPPIPPDPKPDLTPQGSSGDGWKPSVQVPTVQSLRGSIMNNAKPPNC